MKILLAISGSAAAVGGLYAGGALSPGEVYDISVSDARARLAAMSLPPPLLMTAGGSDSAAVSVQNGTDAVEWRIATGRVEPALFTAKLYPEGPLKTRVVLNYDSGKTGANFADRLMSTRFMRGFAETSFAEKVDSVLENRPFDQHAAFQSFAVSAANDPEQMRELGNEIGGMFSETSNQVKAWEQDHSTIYVGKSMNAATRPSVDLPSSN